MVLSNETLRTSSRIKKKVLAILSDCILRSSAKSCTEGKNNLGSQSGNLIVHVQEGTNI